MPEQLEVIAAKGLYTQPNPIADVPDGALDIADDVVITSDDVIEPRRGFTPSATFGTGSSRPHQIYEYGNFIYVHYDAVIGAQVGSTIGSVGGVYNPPPFTNAKVRFAEANKNLYVTTSTGVRRAEQTNVSFLQAGHPRAPAPMACLAKDPSVGGWLTAGNQVAYRVVWGYRDSNGNTVMGEPSGAVTVGPRNNSGDMVALYVPAPATAAGITTGSFFQVYRSAQSTTTPSEEMSLVYEGSYAAPNSAPTTITTLAYSSPALTVTTSSAHGLSVGNTVYLVYNQAAISTSSPFAGGKYTVASVPDATHFTVGYATTGTPGASGGNLGYVFGATDTVVVDTIPDELRGAALYTNPSQEGIAQANTPPPICRDMAPFKGCMAYANTVAKHRLTLTLLAVGAPNGLQVGDTVTVNGTTYTAAASESPTTFALYTGGTAAQNVALTAQSLVRVVNFLGTVTAVYLSGAYDQPGLILLEEQGIGGGTFYATSSAHGSAWSPPLPTIGTTVASSNDAAPNRIAWSKPGQPEAVPLLNYSAVGRKDKAILRITPLRDSLLVWKEDGLFRVTGEDPLSFRADQFDPTVHLVAGETATALANSVFALTDQGVVQVNEAGVTVVSRPIEDKLKGLETTAASAGAWALGYETERSLILGTVSSTTDTYPTQVFVYNYFTRTWVRWARALLVRLGLPAQPRPEQASRRPRHLERNQHRAQELRRHRLRGRGVRGHGHERGRQRPHPVERRRHRRGRRPLWLRRVREHHRRVGQHRHRCFKSRVYRRRGHHLPGLRQQGTVRGQLGRQPARPEAVFGRVVPVPQRRHADEPHGRSGLQCPTGPVSRRRSTSRAPRCSGALCPRASSGARSSPCRSRPASRGSSSSCSASASASTKTRSR
jgi:hypothetical protein